MNGFIKKILAFGAVFFLVVIIIEIRVCYTFNELSFKKEYMEKHASELKTLLVGASNAASGINPAVIGDSCFDMALSAQTFYYTKATCEKFLPPCKHVKNVILPIPYHLIYGNYNYPLNKTNNDRRSSDKCGYLKYMGIKENATDWIYWPEMIWLKQGTLFRCFKDFVTCDSLGFGRNSLSDRGGTWKTVGVPSDIKDELGNADLAFEDNVQNIRAVARICKKLNAKLILVSTPYYETAQKATTSKQRSAIHRFAEEVRKGEYDNVVVYKEYTFDPRFDDNDFFNATHLSEDGAAKFAKILRKDFNL